jgi:hypothetical protein
MSYSHDQPGTLVVVSLGPVVLFLVVLVALTGWAGAAAAAGALCLILLLLFYRLHVEVTRDELRLRFGIGLVGRTFAIRDIEAARPVRNKWWYGWGIRLTPHGWLFNVSGFDAVEIHMRSGKKYRIGTDEPEALSSAVNDAIRG